MHTCAAVLLPLHLLHHLLFLSAAASQTQKLFQRQRRESRMIASTCRQNRSCHAGRGGGGGGGGGQLRDANGGKMEVGGDHISLLCISSSSTLLQAVDRTNISGVPTEAASVPVGGLSIASLAARHQRGLTIPPEHPSSGTF